MQDTKDLVSKGYFRSVIIFLFNFWKGLSPAPVSKRQYPGRNFEGRSLRCPLVPESRCPLARGA
jgi:hypothetical protein